MAIPGLTTATSQTLAMPGGGLSVRENVLPVRVQGGGGWVPVSTALQHGADGSWTAQALPGDSVSFSGGGSGPLAVISAGSSKLTLSWPSSVPAPAVSGSSATYQLLPGVSLVLTATSAQAGGFSEVLVVRDAAAAKSLDLSNLSLGIGGAQVGGVSVAADGSVSVAGHGGRFAAAAPLMWDSAAASLTGLAADGAARQAADKAVGGFIAGESAATGLRSSAAGPALGARMARIGVAASAGGKGLVLKPDTAMVNSPSTAYPLYIDPSFGWNPALPGKTEIDDSVQSSCPDAAHPGNTYSSLGVGYDPWADCQGQPGSADALYEMSVPKQIIGEHVCTESASCAQVEAFETYSAGCSSAYTANVTLSRTAGFDSQTTWNNKPKALASSPPVSVGPDNATSTTGAYTNCNGVEDDADHGQWIPVNFDVRSFMTQAASGKWSFFAVRLSEPSGPTDGTGWKRFSLNPTLDVQYNDTPWVPGKEKLTTGASGSGAKGCTTSPSNAPLVGSADDTGGGPYLWATFDDKDGDTVTGTFQYWDYTAGGAKKTLSAGTNLNGTVNPVKAEIPSSFIAGMTVGDILAWVATATDGTDAKGFGGYSATSNPCYVKIGPTSMAVPNITVTPSSGQVAVGSPVTLSLTSASAADPAVKFVWDLDQQPPTTSVPAGLQCTATSSSCKVSASGAATLQVPVPSAGPHDVWVYAVDAAGNKSAPIQALAPGLSVTVNGTDSPPAACSVATFSAALASPCGNKMISDSTSGSGSANGDGGGNALPYSELVSAGWARNGKVTADGSTFVLPNFGPSGSGNDNVLASGQTISLPGQGSALVFLATSTDGFASMNPDAAINGGDAGDLSSDVTVPYVPGQVPVTGQDCTLHSVQDINDGSCAAATGSVTYQTGTGCQLGNGSDGTATVSQDYFLTVPDWVGGPSDTAVLQLPDRATGSGTQGDAPKLYAFAVPLQTGCQVQSVTLPDIGSTVSTTVGGSNYEIPGLHIFGMSIRNTTTSTPASNGTQAPSGASTAWTAAFASPVERAYVQPGGAAWSNETIRMAVTAGASAPANSSVRIRLEDPMFQAGDVGAPLMIGAATAALQSAPGSPVPQSGTMTTLTFGNPANPATSTTIPEGGDIYSDPVTFPSAITQGQGLLITLYLENGSGGSGVPAAVTDLPSHAWASGAQDWMTAPGYGSAAADTSGTPFTAAGAHYEGSATHLLTSVDVTEPDTALAAHGVDAGMPEIVIAGDSVVNVSGASVVSDPPPDFRIAGQLAGTILPGGSFAGQFAVTEAGIESGQVLAGSDAKGGVSLLARLDRDILSQPDVGGVVVDEGLQDVLGGATSASMATGYAVLATELAAQPGFGIPVVFADLTPCNGATECSSAVDGNRVALNGILDQDPSATQGQLASVGQYKTVSFDQMVSDGGTPAESLLSADGTGDHVNLSKPGYTTAAQALAPWLPTLTESPIPLP